MLAGTAIAVMTDAGKAGIANPGAHGFSEILYAFTSAANNNGSAFAGLSANTPFYNVLLAIAMWFGRFGVIVPVLAIAGSLAAKKRLAATAPARMPTHGPLFVVAADRRRCCWSALLTYVPALALGPGRRTPAAARRSEIIMTSYASSTTDSDAWLRPRRCSKRRASRDGRSRSSTRASSGATR